MVHADIDVVRRYKERGWLTQINSTSLLGRDGTTNKRVGWSSSSTVSPTSSPPTPTAPRARRSSTACTTPWPGGSDARRPIASPAGWRSRRPFRSVEDASAETPLRRRAPLRPAPGTLDIVLVRQEKEVRRLARDRYADGEVLLSRTVDDRRST